MREKERERERERERESTKHIVFCLFEFSYFRRCLSLMKAGDVVRLKWEKSNKNR